jgi:hypothetical protein
MDRVIETLFGSAIQDSKRRFACPICAGLDTSVNVGHNLARCFSCLRNFNPIELVMHQLKISFVDSVRWLQRRMPSDNQHTTSTNKSGNAGPCAIGEILSHMIPSPPPSETNAPTIESIVKKIAHLDHRLKRLDRVVSELKASLNR